MFKVFIKHNLNSQEKKKIFVLKDQFWNFGLKEQKLWFRRNISRKDIHIFFQIKEKLIAYNCLRLKMLNNYKFYLLDTLIVDNKLKKNGYGGYLLDVNKMISLSRKKPIFLKTSKLVGSFYKKFNFNLIIKKGNFLYFDFNNKKKLQNFLKKI
tara:strand:+ start:966 stop:1424 length:459 start_codon:yes stop_codon:yes gene_type:complete